MTTCMGYLKCMSATAPASGSAFRFGLHTEDFGSMDFI